MAIRYLIPTIGAQKGPTCWYTAAKMMLRFHGMIDPEQTYHNEWKELHELRKTITALAKAKEPYDYRSVLKNLISRMTAEDGASPEREHLRSLKRKWESAGSDERFDVLQAFVPGLIAPLPLAGANYDAAFVETSLATYGPLYASVNRPGTSLMDMDYAPDPFPNQTGYVYKYDAKASFGGLHAIVIFGVDAQENIYYADPNNPHRYSVIPWAVLQGELHSPGGSMSDALFGAVHCTNCHHVQTFQS